MIPFSTVDPLLSIDREPHGVACLFPSVNTSHNGADLKAVLMLEICFIFTKAFAPDLYIGYVVSSSDVTAVIQQSLTSNINLPVVKRQFAPVHWQRQVEVVCNKAFSVIVLHGGNLLDSGILFKFV